MAVRALRDLKNACIHKFIVATGVTIVPGGRVIFNVAANDDKIVDNSGADSDLAFGTFHTDQLAIVGDGVTTWADVILDGHQIVPMVVGTGGSTRGKKQKFVANGVTDAETNGGGTTPHDTVGVALQTGVAGDVIGVLQPGVSRYVAAT